MKRGIPHIMVGGSQDTAFHDDGSYYRLKPRESPGPWDLSWRREPNNGEKRAIDLIDWERVQHMNGYRHPLVPYRDIMTHREFTTLMAKNCPGSFATIDKWMRKAATAFRELGEAIARTSRISALPLTVMEGKIPDTIVAKTRFVEGPVRYARLQHGLESSIMRRCDGHRRRQGRIRR